MPLSGSTSRRNVIALVPVGAVGEETLRDLLPVIGAAFHRVVELGPGITIPGSAYDPARRQHLSTAVLDALAAARRPGWERLLGVADIDLYVPRLNFVFGEADAARGVAIFSLARLHAAPDSEGRARFLHRAAVEAVHELGHTWNLAHCRD
jgi:archaemetzincin